jgi:hypothetical protein
MELPTDSEPVPPPPHPAADSLPAEFAALYETHSKQVFYLALRLLGDPTLAEDAAHDVFLKAWRNLSHFRGDAAVTMQQETPAERRSTQGEAGLRSKSVLETLTKR